MTCFVGRPLSEGKVLKTKFDEIFASTRYTRALESFKKIQLELVSWGEEREGGLLLKGWRSV